MPKNHMVKFLVDREQMMRIRYNALARGLTVSGYLRDLALHKELRMEQILIEIHREVVNGRAARLG